VQLKIVVALGGNALLKRGEPLTEEVQSRNVGVAARSVAATAREHRVVVTHGNGPQVGLLALTSEAYREVPPYGLDVLGAESQGMIGFLLEQSLRNALPERSVAAVLTTVRVDPQDPAFENPTKPVGPVYLEQTARKVAAERGWTVARDGAGFRRVVPSPDPRQILELDAIQVLVDHGILVVCAGGGGVPVYAGPDGLLTGVEGVVDKDRTSSLLAEELGADWLLLLTDVDAVYSNWGTPAAKPIESATRAALRQLSFEAGTMAPKVEAACRFVERTGRMAAIGSLANAPGIILDGKGTVVHT
jgi:carbamate kinase